MKWLIVGSIIWISGCAMDGESQSLELYFLNSNYVQEQKNSSKKEVFEPSEEASNWAQVAFAERCEWFDLERVVDGDTLMVRDSQDRIRVRMIGIDTPESKKEGTPIEAFALEASAQLSDLLKDSEKLCLVEDRVGDAYDTYGRKLSYVFSETGADINAAMIVSGYAEAYTRFPMERTEEFEALEMQARQQALGQWVEELKW